MMLLKILLQFLVFLVYMVFLFRYIKIARAGRKYLKDITAASCVPDSKNNGKIVHINCRLDKSVVNYVGKEFWSNIYSHNGIFVETKVEIFQWVPRERMTGKFYSGEFVDHLLPSNIFYKNPNFIPNVGGSGRVYAKQIKIGGYIIGREWFVNLNNKSKLKVDDDEWYEPSSSVPPVEISNLNTQVFNDFLYTGDIINPKIGDIRISFYGSEDIEFSVIGRQTGTLLGEYQLKPVEFLNKKMVLVAGKFYDKQELQDYIFSQISKTNIEILRIVLILLLSALVYEEIKSEKVYLLKIN
ncbi:uncharacterized protein TA13370 [Theileria annulata]|uniref:Uncharacterized protein n=1 Tax=Theileria annulata TaxID=5874 RepID=Q4UEH7_THEAN|nr:uncharacterized protein TA13370 [Theileria annulata]CAI74512.1 hypothetical protein, conserved [Theileria annulata]|eukprot:XP_952244.1 hypothetical protein, conserved [Theileria annulata]